MSSPQPSPDHPRTTIAIPTTMITVGSLLSATSCVVALVVIVSLKNVDELATIALALAVLAFLVQLIVFIVQSASANEQALQAQQLNSATIEILSQLQERTQGTQQSLERMNSELLSAALGKSIPQMEAEGSKVVNPEYFDRLARSVRAMMALGVNDRDNARRIPVAGVLAPPLHADEADALRSYMERWTEPSELDEVFGTIKSLTPSARHNLLNMGADMVRFTQEGSEVGPGFCGVPSGELLDAGLVTNFMVDEVPFYTLSPKGRKIVRIATAKGPTPSYVSNELLDLFARRRHEGAANPDSPVF